MADTPAASRVTGAPAARPSRKRGAGRPARVNLFYVPAVVLLGLFTAYPLVRGILLSFQNWDGYSPDMTFVGLANYARLFTDQVFRTSLLNTFVYGFGSTLVQQVLGLALAVALDRALRGRNVVRAIIYLPVLVSPVIMGTMYYLLFQYNSGTINDIVIAFGGHRHAWLSDSATSVALIVLVNSLQFVGISMIIYLAGLQSIPAELQEAAMLDGAGGWKRFWGVTLPLLQPAFATSIVLNLIGGLKLFDVIQVLTGGGPGYSTNSVSTFIGKAYFDNQSAGYASAMGVALFVLIIVFTLVLNLFLNRRRLEM
ncbi:carbohydrate ABC transporter permease [Frondihabitans cladoniiphilus]|uniref:Sugar ABC transporter permease n=1 Tax=Frondihabitans cladoniiphilus TaxID=715785 RepID=A0ABP8WBB1_9MICO